MRRWKASRSICRTSTISNKYLSNLTTTLPLPCPCIRDRHCYVPNLNLNRYLSRCKGSIGNIVVVPWSTYSNHRCKNHGTNGAK